MVGITDVGLSIAMVIGPVIGYIDQVSFMLFINVEHYAYILLYNVSTF